MPIMHWESSVLEYSILGLIYQLTVFIESTLGYVFCYSVIFSRLLIIVSKTMN
jgi:hypothetical protein